MDKYIKAQDIINAFAEYLCAPLPRSVSYAKTIVDAIPAADVRPVVKGEWRRCELDDAPGFYTRPFIYYCDNCGQVTAVITNFCSNCGADMRGKEEI